MRMPRLEACCFECRVLFAHAVQERGAATLGACRNRWRQRFGHDGCHTVVNHDQMVHRASFQHALDGLHSCVRAAQRWGRASCVAEE